MALNEGAVFTLARELLDAEVEFAPVESLTTRHPDLTKDEAYEIQRRGVDMKALEGDRIAGYKIGATNPGVGLLQVDEPLYGRILASHILPHEAIIPVTQFIDPRAEAEIGFVLGRNLKGPGVTAADALAATESVFAALEINDTRIREWQVKMFDVIADNGVLGSVVLGDERSAPGGLDLSGVAVQFYNNEALFEEATGAVVMGNPAEALAWLANKLADDERGLRKGDVVISGSLTRLMPVTAGDTVRAEFAGLGSVSLTFSRDVAGEGYR